MARGVYERSRSTHICTVCGREYDACDNGGRARKYCPECYAGTQKIRNETCYANKKAKLRAFRQSIGLE